MPVNDPEKRKKIQEAYYERHKGEPCTKCKKNPRRDKGSWCKECSNVSARKYWDEVEKDKYHNDPEHRAKKLKVASKYHLKSTYGLTSEEIALMLEAQGGCKICKANKPNGGRWHVDHNHTTGKVRGILCHMCNVGIGMFKDDTKLLALAIAYLTENDNG